MVCALEPPEPRQQRPRITQRRRYKARKPSAKAVRLLELIHAWQSKRLTISTEAEFEDNIGRLITFRLSMRWRNALKCAWGQENTAHNWRDLQQACWLDVLKCLAKTQIDASASTRIVGWIDNVVRWHLSRVNQDRRGNAEYAATKEAEWFNEYPFNKHNNRLGEDRRDNGND